MFPSLMNRYRYRFRFRKDCDLRWISHRDLLRLFERALRRADLHLSMSQGFHPKPRFSFPLALALGLEGRAEWMEIELQEDLSAEEARLRLQAELPEGITLDGCWRLELQDPKMSVDRVIYRVAIPPDEHRRMQDAIGRFERGEPILLSSTTAEEPVDVRHALLDLRLHEGELTIEQKPGETRGIGPRQVLAAIGLPDLEQQGHVITRMAVVLQNEKEHEPDERINAPPHSNEQQFARRSTFL